MAERPWVTPQEVKDYSETAVVQNRTDDRLKTDIARAEQYVITYTHNTFESYETLPEPVKIAVILLAEVYASYAHIMKQSSGGAYKSESFDDYSYSMGDSSLEDMISALNLASLLDDYVVSQANGTVTMRMRRL